MIRVQEWRSVSSGCVIVVLVFPSNRDNLIEGAPPSPVSVLIFSCSHYVFDVIL